MHVWPVTEKRFSAETGCGSTARLPTSRVSRSSKPTSNSGTSRRGSGKAMATSTSRIEKMRARMVRLHSPDQLNLAQWRPDDPSDAGALIQIFAAPEGAEGEESF